VLHHLIRAAAIVDRDHARVGGRDRGVNGNDRGTVPMMRKLLGQLDVWRHEDQAIDATVHRAQGAVDLVVGIPGRREQELISRALCATVDAAYDLGEELAVEIRKEHAERVRPAGNQRACGAVRSEAEILRGVVDPAAGIITNRS
jgi:hypothetical protein